MPRVRDFRLYSVVATENIDKSGRNVGKVVYWKLYAIENIYRILVHSILSSLVYPENWWVSIDQDIQRKAETHRLDYLSHPWHTNAGNHPIYYVDLKDINEIARAHAHLFVQLIPDIDQWVCKVEMVRLPRNVVAHMNFPNNNDRDRINVLYEDFKSLFMMLQRNSPIVFSAP